eukprot:9125791-Pyramimonas_sp.AAC.1
MRRWEEEGGPENQGWKWHGIGARPHWDGPGPQQRHGSAHASAPLPVGRPAPGLIIPRWV